MIARHEILFDTRQHIEHHKRYQGIPDQVPHPQSPVSCFKLSIGKRVIVRLPRRRVIEPMRVQTCLTCKSRAIRI